MYIDNHFRNHPFLLSCYHVECPRMPGTSQRLKFVWTVSFPHEGVCALSSFTTHPPKFDFKSFILRKWKHFMILIHLRLYKITIRFIFLEKSFILFFHSSGSVIVSSLWGKKRWHTCDIATPHASLCLHSQPGSMSFCYSKMTCRI